MSLDLDKRQRAMLSEMGIKLWHAPSTKGAELAPAAPPEAGREAKPLAQAARSAAPTTEPPATPRAALSPAPAPSPTPVGAQASSGSGAEVTWQLGQPQAIYPSPAEPATTIRWLVLAERPAGASEALDGEAGQLLDNMLRAAGMQRDANLQFVPVFRGRGAEPASETALEDQLAALIESQRPSMVLVMGRLLAQAVLPSDQPFAKRRGQPISVRGCPLMLTYDATFLLRNLPEKARAWEDLCQARLMAAAAARA